MKLPLSWLKKYIDVALPAERLAELLTMSGSKVEALQKTDGEAVIDIEVTTNRPDCLSILGLAHEVSAVTGKKVRPPSAYSSVEKKIKRADGAPTVVIEDKKDCARYTARVVRNVKVSAAPVEAQKLLSLAGTRAISNIVDATNYVLYECGQPLHAFDLDKLRGNRVIVRRSKKGEKFLGIDGVEYALDDKTLVIADAERPVAIAGVIGGKLTEVTASTKNILLESAYFDPALVRQASKKYKLSTESSYRFERGVDIENVGRASRRAAGLIAEWAGGEDASGLLDQDHAPKKKKAPVTLRSQRVEKILGLQVPATRIQNILRALSFSVQGAGAVLKVAPPSSRRDVALEEDLIEEVLRIEGFDKAPETLPAAGLAGRFHDGKAERIPELKKFAAHLGFDEILTYSLLSEKALAQSGFDPARAHAVANAVSAEQAYFRPSLLPGMLQSVLFNAHRKASSLRFFELGNCYEEGREETRLGMALYGMDEENWLRKSEVSFYDLKGAAERVMDLLGAGAFEWKNGGGQGRFDSCADLWKDGRHLGTLGEVSAVSLKKWDIPRPVFFCEIGLEGLLRLEPSSRKVRPVPRFPGVRRDIAFVVDAAVPVAELEGVMRESASPYLQGTTLFDQYTGKNIPPGRRSLAFSLDYQKENGTFTEEEIQRIQQKVGEALKSRFSVEFR